MLNRENNKTEVYKLHFEKDECLRRVKAADHRLKQFMYEMYE